MESSLWPHLASCKTQRNISVIQAMVALLISAIPNYVGHLRADLISSTYTHNCFLTYITSITSSSDYQHTHECPSARLN